MNLELTAMIDHDILEVTYTELKKSNRSVIYNLVCYSIICSGTFWTNSSERKTTQGQANRKKKNSGVYLLR